jgi:hypothetical protein
MAGGRGTAAAEDGPVADPLHRGLFRERALAYYDRWGGEPGESEGSGDSGLAPKWLRTAGLLMTLFLALLAAFGSLVQVPVTGTVLAAVTGGAGGQADRVVAILPAAEAGRVRQGVTVQLTVPGRTGTVPAVLRGDGQVLSAARVGAVVPAFSGAPGLPSSAVLASGSASAALVAGAGRSQLVTARAGLGEQPLFRLAWSAGART